MNKIVYKLLNQYYQVFATHRYYNTEFEDCFHINCNNKKLTNNKILDIVTVSFNNEYVISCQIKLLRKYLRDRYFYTIVDNSTNLVKQNKISRLCKNLKIAYIRPPKNPFLKSPSQSHGSTLNWTYKNYLKPRSAKFLGIIDHDVFPIRPTKIIPYLKKQYIYGHLQERKGTWYLWAGFCFFNSNHFRSGKVDFLPSSFADTGSRNYNSIYTGLKRGKINFPEHSYFKLRKGNNPQSDLIEYIGDWMHTFNASGWMIIKDKNEKNQLVKNLLDKYLREGH